MFLFKCICGNFLVKISYSLTLNVKLSEGNIYFHPKRVQDVKEKVASYFEKNKEITIGQFKDLLGGASRKYALPLLLYFDGLGITERSGDVRVLGHR